MGLPGLGAPAQLAFVPSIFTRMVAELGTHQVSMTNKFFESMPTTVYGTGGIYRYKDGREVNDHVYVTFEYPNERTATFTSIQSNEAERYYEQFMGTMGTPLLCGTERALIATIACLTANEAIDKKSRLQVTQ